jgi:tRNA G26 N,N-dimethylase Trm1
MNTIVAYNSGGQRYLTASNSLNLANVKSLANQIGPKAVKMIQANFATKAKKITKADLVNSNLVIVTDHNVSDPIFITQ